MTKVCHMTSVHPAEDVRIFVKECVSLAQAGYDTFLVTRGNSYDKFGVHIIGTGSFQGNRFKRMTKVAKQVYEKALMIDADIYHIHDPELLPYALKLKNKGKKVVFDSHEYYPEQLKRKAVLSGFVGNIISKTYKLYEDYVCSKIDAVIFPCLKDGKHPFEGRCKRVITLNNVPLLSELYDHYDSSIKKYKRSICHVGSLTAARGITEVVKAAYLSDTTAYIGGVFHSQHYRKKIESLVESKAMKYLGKLDRDEVLDLLQHCQVGLATIHNVGQYNQFDNLATKCYEYMALGLPVILTKAKYNEKVNAKYHFGICVDAENVEEIANAIRYLMDNQEKALEIGRNGRIAILAEFNWEKEKEKLLDLYESLMEQ